MQETYMAKKKIAHVITRLIVGGAQENTLFTVEGLAKNPNYEVTLISGPEKGPEGSLFGGEWQKSVNLIMASHLIRNLNPLRDFLAYRQLYRMFKQGRYDLVHTHSSKAGILARLAAKKAGVPIIIHTIHGLPFHDYQTRAAFRIYVAAEKKAARVTDKIISVADIMSEKAIKAGVAGPEKFVTVYSGMDLDSFIQSPALRDKKRAELGIEPDQLVVGKIARLFNLKGHEYLFAAAPKIIESVPNVKFLLVGDGILRERFEKQLSEMGVLDHFIFTGLVPPDTIPSLIAASDLLVHTSLREGLARVLPQSLAGGKPAVSFDIDGAPEVIKDGQTGRLVKPKDIDGLTEAIIELLDDETKRAAMGQAGRKLVDPIFRHDYMVGKIDEVYREMGL
jgi:glycosyltransferase involved in cell wall biosynthesis